MRPQPEEHENIEQRKMIGDKHGGARRDESLMPMGADGPSGIQPSIEGGPK